MAESGSGGTRADQGVRSRIVTLMVCADDGVNAAGSRTSTWAGVSCRSCEPSEQSWPVARSAFFRDLPEHPQQVPAQELTDARLRVAAPQHGIGNHRQIADVAHAAR